MPTFGHLTKFHNKWPVNTWKDVSLVIRNEKWEMRYTAHTLEQLKFKWGNIKGGWEYGNVKFCNNFGKAMVIS